MSDEKDTESQSLFARIVDFAKENKFAVGTTGASGAGFSYGAVKKFQGIKAVLHSCGKRILQSPNGQYMEGTLGARAAITGVAMSPYFLAGVGLVAVGGTIYLGHSWLQQNGDG